MDAIVQMFSEGVDQLLGRAGGPLHFRLIMMPTVVTILAILAGMRDARDGNPPFLHTLVTNPAMRPAVIRSGLKDVGRVFVVAVTLDTIYQLAFLHAFHIIQLLIVAVGCAFVPYIIVRGPVTRLMRRIYGKKPAPPPATPKDPAKTI